LSVQITVNEIQMIILGTGAAAQASTFKLYMGTEETQDMDASSTMEQIAEEINSFNQLSGPVTVAAAAGSTVARKVTFAAIDGDVAQMTAIGSGDGVTIATRANGWSIEGPVGLGLDTMQAGGIINVTSAETCTFTFDTAATVGYPCYDGVCGPLVATGDLATTGYQDAIDLIQDDNGDKMIATTTTIADPVVTVVMPMGKSCDGLEIRGTTNEVTKTVEKNNNGKQFKITRSFLQETAAPSPAAGEILTTVATCAPSAQGTTGCYQVEKYIDSVLIGDKGSCGAKVDADGHTYPISRTVTAVDRTTAAATFALTIGTIGGSDLEDSKCDVRIARHVITLDSMPTESLCTGSAAANCPIKTLLYTSPVGSCNVAETTKGTYESFECSNRGACDGKSGLCTCYEGYSGQSCQTQTVLV